MRKRGAAGAEKMTRRRAACCAADYAGLPISRFIDVEALPPSPHIFALHFSAGERAPLMISEDASYADAG
jgi:hypothetical protein